MRKIAFALIAAAGLSLAAPAFAGIADSGAVGEFNQWARAEPAQTDAQAKQPAGNQTVQQAQPAAKQTAQQAKPAPSAQITRR